MGIKINEISLEELAKIIEDTQKGNLLDLLVDEEIYWVSYLDIDESFVVDTFIDAPKYFNTPLEAANYLSNIYAHK